METQEDKFKRLAEKRVTRILKDLELVGNLSNRKNYDYSESDVTKIINTLQKSLNNVKNKFELSKDKTGFKL